MVSDFIGGKSYNLFLVVFWNGELMGLRHCISFFHNTPFDLSLRAKRILPKTTCQQNTADLLKRLFITAHYHRDFARCVLPV